ncbi:hypothetical protein SAMN05421835_101498 [Amycolatopsis sacchari]|uniref:Uncharacterized protein n=1 Tax=Amycolatopsis sacchari TaxID=115433 RepID=A0A1I3KCI2_9PSEU|nr:hypothetical protein SAMN05421835_101498 [Amycolatopsis sacchari]
MCLVAHGFDAAVGALPAGRVEDLLGRVGLGEVDRLRADLLGEREPSGFLIHHENLGGAPDDRAVRGHQPDGPRAEHHHRLAGTQPGEFGAVPAGGEDVGEHGEVVLVVVARRQPEQVEVRVGHAEVFGLPAVVRAHVGVAVGRAVHAFGGVGAQAERRPASLAVAAGPAGDVERHRDAATGLDAADGAARLRHDAHVLVAEDLAFLHRSAAFVHVQIGSADVGGGDVHDRITRRRAVQAAYPSLRRVNVAARSGQDEQPGRHCGTG